MANVEINDLTLDASPASADEFELQETSGGLTKKGTLGTIPAGAVAGFYISSASIADDDEYIIPDFVGAGESLSGILIITSDTSGAFPVGIVEVRNDGLTTIYAPASQWQIFVGDVSSSQTGTDGDKVLWVNNTTNPRHVVCKNRSGSARAFRFFMFSHSTLGA